jgi:hypothetical protein
MVPLPLFGDEIHERQFALRAEGVCPTAGGYSVHRRIISDALIPPNPKEFDSATSKLWAMALFGT